MAGLARRLAVALSAVAQLGFSVGLFAGAERPFEPPPGGPSPAEPAGYAFAIWGPIFLSSLVLAAHQLRRSQADDPVLRRIGWPVAIGFGATAAWLLFARFGPLWATVPTIALILATLGWSFVQAARAEQTRGRRWLVAAPLALFAGWITAATFVNAAEVLPAFGFDRFGLGPTSYAIWGVLLPVLVVAVAVLERTRWDLVYAGAVAWAVVAVAVANVQRGFGPAVPAMAAAVLVALLGFTVFGRVLERKRAGGSARRASPERA